MAGIYQIRAIGSQIGSNQRRPVDGEFIKAEIWDDNLQPFLKPYSDLDKKNTLYDTLLHIETFGLKFQINVVFIYEMEQFPDCMSVIV